MNGTVSPLPVKLGDLYATLTGADATIEWYTLQEKNSKKFIVQRSDDGIVFKNIGTVRAAGESNSKRSYSFTDAGVVNSGKPTVHYRLLIVDKDEKTDRSKIIFLRLAGTNWSIPLLQNPVQENAPISLTGVSEKATIKIADVNGKTLYTATARANGILNIPTGNFAKGMYFIIVENEKERKVKSFIKE